MKIGIFTDVHYCKAEVLCETRRPSMSLGKLKEAMDAFKSASVDFCLCLGDLTDHAEGDTKADVVSCYNEVLNLIFSYEIPFYFVPGNHDYLMLGGKEIERSGLRLPPYKFTAGDIDFILLDANYRSDGRRFDEAGVEWTDSNLPEEQCEFLREALSVGENRKIVCIHENLDPSVEARHIVKNAEQVRNIIKGRTEIVLQGHYHPGATNIIDGIPYITLPAMCEGEENSYRILDL